MPLTHDKKEVFLYFFVLLFARWMDTELLLLVCQNRENMYGYGVACKVTLCIAYIEALYQTPIWGLGNTTPSSFLLDGIQSLLRVVGFDSLFLFRSWINNDFGVALQAFEATSHFYALASLHHQSVESTSSLRLHLGINVYKRLNSKPLVQCLLNYP